MKLREGAMFGGLRYLADHVRCGRCSTDWPIDRMINLKGVDLCEICWRVVIFPYRTVPQYTNARKNRRRRMRSEGNPGGEADWARRNFVGAWAE